MKTCVKSWATRWATLGMASLMALVLCQTVQAAAVVDPIVQLQKVSDQMLVALKANEASMSKDPTKVYQIVNRILLPYVDITAMSRSALGREAWMSASKLEQKQFCDEFTLLMQATYAAGLSSYKDEKVVFDAVRGGITPDQKRIEVNSQIVRTDGPAINVSYRLVLVKDVWLVYDFSVEGVSMVESFRSQFAADLSRGTSVADLTKKLKLHNSKVL